MIDHYEWSGGREAMLRFGAADGVPVVVVALPLFEEANRVRAFAVTICRELAKRDIASVLPDLPGQGESLHPLETTTLADLRGAYRSLADRLWDGSRRTYAAGIRSGSLLDTTGHVCGRWHFAPQDAESLLSELTRIRQAAIGPSDKLGPAWFVDSIAADGADVPIEIAGNLLSPGLLHNLLTSTRPEGPLRIVRLDTDPRPADRHIPGTPLWRRSEPTNDPALAALLADDIAEWIARCEG